MYDHVWPWDEEDLVKVIQVLRVESRRGGGRPKLTWKHVTRADLRADGSGTLVQASAKVNFVDGK